MDTLTGISHAVHLLKQIFREMPDTRLSPSDVSRVSGLDEDACAVILHVLEDTRFLTRGRDGRYQRRVTDSVAS